ncbi:MAG: hypothetical protein Q8K99_03605 [Actinomycetota bacterium]|nr:hypothetical protein [Actinomycetota bacterium]
MGDRARRYASYSGVFALIWAAPAIQFLHFGSILEGLSSAGMGIRAVAWVATFIYVAVPAPLLFAGCLRSWRVATERHSVYRRGVLTCMLAVVMAATAAYLVVAVRLDPFYARSIPAFVAITPLLASALSLCTLLVFAEPYSSKSIGLRSAFLAVALAAGLAVTTTIQFVDVSGSGAIVLTALSIPARVVSLPVTYLIWMLPLPRMLMGPMAVAWVFVVTLPLLRTLIARTAMERDRPPAVPVPTVNSECDAELKRINTASAPSEVSSACSARGALLVIRNTLI